ncbi:ubiquinol-cytochrome-c reductase complex assembly factor 1-like [Sparus aurata]|uniref:ubiquinol-cytochrome-c reductase complex assembly factor 1-like n=1 Tax=Sparus aurata TaxID=8175 RepID=UPI0011C0F4C9|nr:ubiquinol-cytochrome-c reductase complex assembly factor 1-like [Sparus aurata]
MYRRPLQSFVRTAFNATASRTAGGKVLDQEACFARALVACQLARVSSPSLTPCRTLHMTTQLYNVKETPQHTEEEVGAFTKLIEAMGFTGPLKYNKWKIKIAALRMYTCCVERINYDDFFDKCSLPDTLNSWFLVAQLHVWMCLVRMRQEGREGKYMCTYIVHSMWEDVEQRSKIMGVSSVYMCVCVPSYTASWYPSGRTAALNPQII